MVDYSTLTMNSMSNYLKNTLLNILLKQSADYFSEAWLALYSTTQTVTDTGIEISSGNYERVLVHFEYTDNTAYLSAGVVFPTASTTWGDIAAISIRDAETGGNLLFFANLTNQYAVQSGQTFKISADALQVTLGHPYTTGTYGGWAQNFTTNILEGILSSYTLGNFIYGTEIALGRNLVVNTSYNMTSWTEISATDYLRYAADANLWANPSAGATYNLTDIVFTNAATEDWGEISHIVMYDKAQQRPFFWGLLNTPRTIITGDGFKIPAGYLQISFQAPSAET